MKQYLLTGINLNLGGVIYPENSVINFDSEPDSFLSKYLVEIPPNSSSANNLIPNTINSIEQSDPLLQAGPVSQKQKHKLKGKFKP